MVVVSWITQTEVKDTVKYPILLSNKHRINYLIIQNHQQRRNHGINLVVASIRQRWYVPRARKRIHTVINTCMRCSRKQGVPYRGPPETLQSTPVHPLEQFIWKPSTICREKHFCECSSVFHLAAFIIRC